MKVYLHGRDNIGWSIDSDRKQIYIIANNFITKNAVYSIVVEIT